MAECAATAASSPLRLAWEQHLPLLLRHLHDQADRWALRLVCREWRTAVDHVSCPGHCADLRHQPNFPDHLAGVWQPCFTSRELNSNPSTHTSLQPPPQACHKAALDISADEAAAGLRCGTQFLLPHVSELVLAEVSDLQQQLPGLLPTLQRSSPALRALVVSAPLGRQVAPASWLALLPLQLQRLELVDMPLPGGRLESVSHSQQLTELSISLTAAAPGSVTTAAGVACLTCLRGLQVRRWAGGVAACAGIGGENSHARSLKAVADASC